MIFWYELGRFRALEGGSLSGTQLPGIRPKKYLSPLRRRMVHWRFWTLGEMSGRPQGDPKTTPNRPQDHSQTTPRRFQDTRATGATRANPAYPHTDSTARPAYLTRSSQLLHGPPTSHGLFNCSARCKHCLSFFATPKPARLLRLWLRLGLLGRSQRPGIWMGQAVTQIACPRKKQGAGALSVLFLGNSFCSTGSNRVRFQFQWLFFRSRPVPW